MESAMKIHQARAQLEWQVELGATEAIGDVPINRYDLPDSQPKPKLKSAATANMIPQSGSGDAGGDATVFAAQMAAEAGDLDQLQRAIESFELCQLKRGAKTTVFADGNPAARVMIIGEAPGRDEDIRGLPFVGRAGKLLDKMFAAIGMARDSADSAASVYITNILPWRPPQNRDPLPDEIAVLLPFVKRHVELAQPELLVLMGNVSCLALLGRKGITRLRGNWTTALNLPALPMFHPAYLLRNPQAKREAWHDLLMLQARLREA
ncbi:MAG: uracil-DNA glycosylase [Paracoccaceae bacterium]